MAKTSLGKLAPSAIGMMELPRLDAKLLVGFRELGDLTGTTSDALDDLGIAGAVPASLLKPTDPRARVVGQAITVLNRAVSERRKVSGLAEIEAHHLAEPGDVLVIQGVANISSMGGVSASVGKRQGEAGAIVDGAVRDTEKMSAMGFTVFARGRCIYDSQNRQRVIDIDVPIEIDGVRFSPGDLVIADVDGVVVVPAAVEQEAISRAWQKVHAENVTRDAIKAGMKAVAAYQKFGVL